MNPIQVFRAGRHTAQNGVAYNFSQADVAQIAAAYDPALHAAPVVLGHPKTDDPAWGWVAAFSVDDAGCLVPEFERVDAAFADGVEAGRYRYTSMALYEPDQPGNPKPGSWYPRHVGYLGATPPAIKGLTAAFSEADAPDGVVFGDGVLFSAPDQEIAWVARAVAAVVRRLRDWFIEKEGLEVADRIMPAWNDEWLTEIAAKVSAEQGDGVVGYSDQITGLVLDQVLVRFAEATPTPAATTETIITAPDAATLARQAEMDAREARVAAREVAFAESAQAASRDADAAFLDQLVAAGRLPPGYRAGLLANLAHARGDASGVSFAEGVDAHAALRTMLDGLGVAIVFSEAAAGGGADVLEDPASMAGEISRIHAEAAASGQAISFSEAAGRVGRS